MIRQEMGSCAPSISVDGGRPKEPPSQCKFCGAIEELRLGCCWECAVAGEERAATRTVMQHLGKGLRNLITRRNWYGRYDFAWAWERLTKTGDYAPGGYFETSDIPVMARLGASTAGADDTRA